MGAIAVHHTATDDGAWDGPANEARLRSGESEAYYRRAYAWQDPDGNPEAKSSWRFIHHMVGGDGEPGAASTRGCSTGIGALNGGRGGTTIPDGDRRAVYNHLAAHLSDADMEPPELQAGRGEPGANVERRVLTSSTLEVRETPEGPILAGYAAVFNEWSEDLGGFHEQIAPGFFGPVLADDVRALWQHDPAYVLGRTTTGTLRLTEDGRGLAIEIQPPESQWARDVLVSLRRGDVSGMSFGFAVAEDRWEQGAGPVARRTLIRAARLYDVSPVTFPAYPQTSVSVRQYLADLRAQEARADQLAAEERTRARDDLMLKIKIRQKRGV